MKRYLILTSLLLSMIPAVAGPPQLSVTPVPNSEPEGWHPVRVAQYVWVRALEGEAGISPLIDDVNMGFDDVLGDLDFAYTAVGEIRNGNWSIASDLNYAEMSDAIPGGRDYKVKQFLGNISLHYELARGKDRDHDFLSVYLGSRLNWVDNDITFPVPGGPVIHRSGDSFWADAVAGFRFQVQLGKDIKLEQDKKTKWFVRGLADIGAGDSDLTWQATALIGMEFKTSWFAGVGYRAISTDYHNKGFTYDITSHGPMIGVEYRFGHHH